MPGIYMADAPPEPEPLEWPPSLVSRKNFELCEKTYSWEPVAELIVLEPYVGCVPRLLPSRLDGGI